MLTSAAAPANRQVKMTMSNNLKSRKEFIATLLLAASMACSAIAPAAELDVDQEQRYDTIRQVFAKQQPGISISSVTASPVPGLYELHSDGRIYYVSEQADYIIDGNLFDVPTLTNITTKHKVAMHLDLIDEVDEGDMIIYQPEQPTIGTATIFTDTSCPYCQKLHSELEVLLSAGVKVRYMLYPRAGLESEAYLELQSVWCSDNPQAALTKVKSGKAIPVKSCDNPIEKHMEIAKNVDLVGTPLIYLDNGEMIAGYKPAEELISKFSNSVN